MKNKNQSSAKLYWIGGLAVVAVGLFGYFGGWFKAEAKVAIKGARVERGSLTISVLQRGNLAAKDAVSIKSEIEGQSTILALIKEGTFVKPGDLLVELDSSDLLEKKVAQDISLQNAEASFAKAKASFDIQESQNKSDIESADRKLTFAKIDRNKYLEGDFEQLKKAANEKIILAEAERAKSKDTITWSKKLSERGFLTKSELDRDELDFQRSEITLEQAIRARELLTKYDDVRRRAELDANLREAERGLERAELQAASRLIDYQSALATSKSKLDLEKEKLQKYIDQLSKAKIRAKDSGMVVYARTEGGRMGGGDPIQEGTQVRERQEILTIPRTNGLIVEASIHESVLKRVAVGNRCKIRADSIPEREFEGIVQFVALLADKNSWWANPNQRLYRTEIQVVEPDVEMRPGMSVSIDILSDSVADCLSIPLQAIVLDKGKTTAFVVKGTGHEQRDVKVGRSNDAKVEVLAGLVEGEEVLLAPPPGFTPTSADETQKAASDAAGLRAGAAGASGGQNVPAGMGGPTGMGAPPSARGEAATGADSATPSAAGDGTQRSTRPGGDGQSRRRRPPSDGSAPVGSATAPNGSATAPNGSASAPNGDAQAPGSATGGSRPDKDKLQSGGGTPEKEAEGGGAATPGGKRD